MPTSTSQMDEVRQRFSVQDSAQKWHEMYAGETEKLDEYNFRRRRDFTIDYVLRVVKPDARVLDLGCGTAPVLSELRRNGVNCSLGPDRRSDAPAGDAIEVAERLRSHRGARADEPSSVR